MRGRIATNGTKMSEIELFIDRARGDDGFTFGADELMNNDAGLMSPPAGRKKATRKELMALSRGEFGTYVSNFNVGSTCHFTELGWTVIDPSYNGSYAPIQCGWKSDGADDANARPGLIIDEELGFAIEAGMISGKVYAYGVNGTYSAFIPYPFAAAQEAQVAYINKRLG